MTDEQIKATRQCITGFNQIMYDLQKRKIVPSYELKIDLLPDHSGCFLLFQIFNHSTGLNTYEFFREYKYRSEMGFDLFYPVDYDTFIRDFNEMVQTVMRMYSAKDLSVLT